MVQRKLSSCYLWLYLWLYIVSTLTVMLNLISTAMFLVMLSYPQLSSTLGGLGAIISCIDKIDYMHEFEGTYHRDLQ